MLGSKKLITSKGDEFLQQSNYQANNKGRGWAFTRSRLLPLQCLQLGVPENPLGILPQGSKRGMQINK